ncbi:MAG TPA: hypothetical protein VD699_03850 [Nitrosopumilaceae archaeon]|nr:hypothetical protein [Nitrosopumilaceae archaeon]
MKDMLVKGLIIAILLVSALFFMVSLPKISAASDLVSVTATNHDQVTVIEYKNNEENIFDITSVVLKVDDGGSFKSFKTERGWIGKKTDVDTITFMSTIPIKPGQSVKFGVKTDKSNPVFNWEAFDKEGDEIGSGGRITTSPQDKIPDITETPTIGGGITERSTFKIIPDTPRVGSTMRIIGENFASREKFDFYINDLKIESFVSDGEGKFILSTKIPENTLSERADFIIKDQSGHQKSVSLRIQGVSSRITEGIELTINADSVFHRGEEKIISGTAESGSTLTISISDSSGQVLTTYTVKADGSGNYSTPHKIPSDREFGEYTITITDGKDTVVRKYVLESTQKINLAPLRERYDPGEIVIINGTAIANKEIELILRDPVGMEIHSENRMVGANGTLTFNYKLTPAIREGTYLLFATQEADFSTVLFGVGQLPSPPLIATMDALNYKTSDKPKINIIGPPSATVSLIIIDPSDKQKFADSFSLGIDGYHTYSFNLTGYTSGIYTAVISRGNVHAENKFSVGLQTSTGKVTLRTLQESYHPGDPILLIGDSNPNVIITVSLTDPNGIKVKTQDVFTDKKGTYSSSVFRIPSNAQSGIWKLEAGSGINHVSKDLTVTQSTEGGITILLDKSSYKIDETMQIKGSGASPSHTIVIKILKDQTEITKLSIVSTGVGTYGTIWKIPTDLSPGTYKIKVEDEPKSVETTFTIQ